MRHASEGPESQKRAVASVGLLPDGEGGIRTPVVGWATETTPLVDDTLVESRPSYLSDIVSSVNPTDPLRRESTLPFWTSFRLRDLPFLTPNNLGPSVSFMTLPPPGFYEK